MIWSTDEDAKLRLYASQGMTSKEIARAIGLRISDKAVNMRMRRIGVKRLPRGRRTVTGLDRASGHLADSAANVRGRELRNTVES